MLLIRLNCVLYYRASSYLVLQYFLMKFLLLNGVLLVQYFPPYSRFFQLYSPDLSLNYSVNAKFLV